MLGFALVRLVVAALEDTRRSWQKTVRLMLDVLIVGVDLAIVSTCKLHLLVGFIDLLLHPFD